VALPIDPNKEIPTDKHWQARISEQAFEILSKEGEKKGLLAAVDALFEGQIRSWPELNRAVGALEKASTRKIQVDRRSVKLQLNPARLVNVTARITPVEVASRPCPICPQNMPAGQKALPLRGGWLVVCNPLPLFCQHLVLVSREHTPQTVRGILGTMIHFTSHTGFTTLYNGPGSGASIPDHLHIQAAPQGWIPLEGQLPQIRNRFSGALIQQGLPQRIFLAAESVPGMEKLFNRTIFNLNRVRGLESHEEPELNLAVIFREPGVLPLVAVHPRSRHRPACYYLEGEQKFMVSPGAADMAGLVILPRRRDFERLDGRLVRKIFEEVCLPKEQFSALAEEMAK